MLRLYILMLYSFLYTKSNSLNMLDHQLLSWGLTCRLWNTVASDNHLWESLHATFFGNLDVHSNHAETEVDTDWRNAIERSL